MGIIQYLVDHLLVGILMVAGTMLFIPVFLTWLIGGRLDWIAVALLIGSFILMGTATYILRKWHRQYN